MKITDQSYSILQDEDIRNRTNSLNKTTLSNDEDEIIEKFKEFLEWEKKIQG
jgi:hypothetical protein